MKFNGKNHKNNQNRKTHKKAKNIPLFKFEPLEERLMLSATAAEWQNEINDIASAYHFSIDNTFTQAETIGGLYNVDAQTGVLSLAKLSDVIEKAEQERFNSDLGNIVSQAKTNFQNAVASALEQAVETELTNYKKTLSPNDQEYNVKVTTEEARLRAEYELSTSEILEQIQNGTYFSFKADGDDIVLEISVEKQLSKPENQNLIASLYDLPENSLNLHVSLEYLNSVLEYNLAIKLNGKDTAEATTENLSAAAQFRQVTAADENAASYGALGLQSVADAENDSVTPDLILGLSRDLAAVNTVV